MTTTDRHNWDIPDVGADEDTWGTGLNNFFEDDLDALVPLSITTGTITASGGSSPAVNTTIADVSSDQTEQFDVVVSVDSDPSFSADYGFNWDWSQLWDDSDQAWDIEITVNWDTDPGSSNDVSLKYEVFGR